MKKIVGLTSIVLMLVVIASGSLLAMDQLITIPTADMISGRGLVRGEIIFDGERSLEAVFPIHPQLQIGAIGILNKNNDEMEAGASAKAILVGETNNQPALSAGIKNRDLYLVMSKNINYSFRIHIGIGNGELGGVYVGVNKLINPVSLQVEGDGKGKTTPPINLMAEYVNQQVNLGTRVGVQDNFDLDVGLLDFNKLQAGIGYRF